MRSKNKRILPTFKLVACLILFILLTFVLFVFSLASDPVVSRHMNHLTHSHFKEHIKAIFERGTYLTSTALQNLYHLEPVKQDSVLPSIYLEVGNNTLLEMDRAITGKNYSDPSKTKEGKLYFNAIFQQNKEEKHLCKIRMKGWGIWHHDVRKPSLRIRFKKNDSVDGQRYIDLERPEDILALKNWIPDYLGREWGLMSQNARHTRLFINNKYYGVYLQTTRQGEALSIKHNQMAGTFFKGDAYGPYLWDNVTYWKLAGNQSPAAIEAFNRFLELLKLPKTKENITELKYLLDFEKYARWSALMTVVGSDHADIQHNHNYFFNPNKGLLEPLVWDSNGYGITVGANLPIHLALHPLMTYLNALPEWVHQRNEIIYDMMKTDFHPQQLARFITKQVQLLKSDLMSDSLLHFTGHTSAGWQSTPCPVNDIDNKTNEIIHYTKLRHSFLVAQFNRCHVMIHPDEAVKTHPKITLFSQVAVDVYDKNNKFLKRLHPNLSQQKHKYKTDQAFECVEALPTSHQLHLPLKQLSFRNAITGKILQIQSHIKKIHTGQSITLKEKIYQSPKTAADIILGPGHITLHKNIYAGVGQKIIIKAGTELKLKAGVGIYGKGPLIAEGRKDAPIKITSADSTPWACIGISGKESAGSCFSYMQVNGGSIGNHGALHFKGMFNVYNSPKVTMKNCVVGKNYIGDDAVNFAECHVLIDNCRWVDARSDALDLDICTGKLTNVTFINSGNDGLDLMTCNITLNNSHFEGSGDKGISIGENSRLEATNCKIIRCRYGIEIKDSSFATVKYSQLDKNLIAVHAYQKKTLFKEGGSGLLENCQITGSVEGDLSIEKKCRLRLVKTKADKILKGEERIFSY